MPLRWKTRPNVDDARVDGGLPHAAGVAAQQVVRASRDCRPEVEHLGWTYNHAPMLAVWRGRLHLSYLSSPQHEHVAPCATLWSSSGDGVNWSRPAVLFPSATLADGQQTVMHQRMGFYVMRDGSRLLACGFHGLPPWPNDGRGIGRVVREIRADGTLGEIFFVRINAHAGWSEAGLPYRMYTRAEDAGILATCEELLADHLMTMQWWEEDRDQAFYPVHAEGEFGCRAMSCYRRQDGAAVALWKGGYAAVSRDDGHSWSRPVQCAGFRDANAKLWCADVAGEYLMAWCPRPVGMRYPLAVARSADGETFADLRAVHAHVPAQRYPGQYKDVGPQYVRGIEATDRSAFTDKLWLAYSVNKEDIWVTSVPRAYAAVGWSLYAPAWGTAEECGGGVYLESRDPWEVAMGVLVTAAPTRVILRGRFGGSGRIEARKAELGQVEVFRWSGEATVERVIEVRDVSELRVVAGAAEGLGESAQRLREIGAAAIEGRGEAIAGPDRPGPASWCELVSVCVQ